MAEHLRKVSRFHCRKRIVQVVLTGLFVFDVAVGASDPAREKQLRDALAVFDGDWTGEVIIWDSFGAVVDTVSARRHHRWVGDVQIAVTAFEIGADTVSLRMRRWIEDDRLRAVVYGPAGPPETYRGELDGEGIAWFNLANGHRSLADRIIDEDGVRKMEATSVERIHLAAGSEPVCVDAVFERHASTVTHTAPQDEPSPVDPSENRITAIEEQLLESSVASSTTPLDFERPQTEGEGATAAAAQPAEPQRAPPDGWASSDAVEAEPAAEDSEAGPNVVPPDLGSVFVSSDPPYVPFVVRAVDSNSAHGFEPRTGTTPELVEGLPMGEYSVSFQREGWPEQTAEVAIYKATAESLFHRFIAGSIEITSEPSGARVLADGRFIGLTPLTMRNVPPGKVAYMINRSGFRAAEVSGEVHSGRNLVLRVDLEIDGSVVAIAELDARPVPTRRVAPKIGRDGALPGQMAMVEMTVDRRGEPRDLELISTTDEAFGQLCLEAAARWRFEPGRIGNRPVNTRVQVPFVTN